MLKALPLFVVAVSLSPFMLQAETVTISGSNTIGAKLIPECAKQYLTKIGGKQATISNPRTNEFIVNAQGVDIDFTIQAHGSETGFKDLLADKATIAMASRRINDKEAQSLDAYGDMRSLEAEHTIAVDGLAILVHPSNPVSKLSIKQISQIYSGKITRWSELGGNNIPINVYARDKQSGTWDTFKNLVLQKTTRLSDKALRFESNDELSGHVSTDSGAIGFSGVASINGAKALAITEDGAAAIVPSRLSIATEDYPLSRRLFVYVKPNAKNKSANDFLEFCQSGEGQDVVALAGFVSQNITAVEQGVTSNAPDHYQKLSDHADRLTVNFRFRKGSALLDNKSSKDIERLINFSNQSENKDRSIYLVGFTDTQEMNKRSKILTRYRALTVWSKLLENRVKVTEMISVGSFMPLSVEDETLSEMKNSRVEVWIAKNDPNTNNAIVFNSENSVFKN